MAEIPKKYFFFPICPSAIRSFLCISFLIFLRLKCLSHYEIFIFSIPLAYGSVSLLKPFKENLNLLNAPLLLLVYVQLPALEALTACPLGPLSCLLGTHGSLGPVPMGRSNEDIKSIDTGQPSLCLPACRVAGQPHICLRKKMSVYY